MHTQHSDSQEDKLLPGTLLDSGQKFDHLHSHISHQHRHSLSYTTPALVEVNFNLLNAKIIVFFFSLVQLHIHLEGSFRHSTLFELAQKKGRIK